MIKYKIINIFKITLQNTIGSNTTIGYTYNYTVSGAIQQSTTLMPRLVSLNNEIEEFKKLILSLGKSEVESQERLIDLTVENLKKLTVESKEDIKNKGNLYKKLITFSGICIGIILI